MSESGEVILEGRPVEPCARCVKQGKAGTNLQMRFTRAGNVVQCMECGRALPSSHGISKKCAIAIWNSENAREAGHAAY